VRCLYLRRHKLRAPLIFSRRPRRFRGAALLAGDLLDELVQRAHEDGRRISIRSTVAQPIASAPGRPAQAVGRLSSTRKGRPFVAWLVATAGGRPAGPCGGPLRPPPPRAEGPRDRSRASRPRRARGENRVLVARGG